MKITLLLVSFMASFLIANAQQPKIMFTKNNGIRVQYNIANINNFSLTKSGTPSYLTVFYDSTSRKFPTFEIDSISLSDTILTIYSNPTEFTFKLANIDSIITEEITLQGGFEAYFDYTITRGSSLDTMKFANHYSMACDDLPDNPLRPSCLTGIWRDTIVFCCQRTKPSYSEALVRCVIDTNNRTFKSIYTRFTWFNTIFMGKEWMQTDIHDNSFEFKNVPYSISTDGMLIANLPLKDVAPYLVRVDVAIYSKNYTKGELMGESSRHFKEFLTPKDSDYFRLELQW